MTSELLDDLNRIKSGLERLSRTVLLNALAPGRPAEYTRNDLALAGLASNCEIECLYQWHDGTAFTDEHTLGQIWMFPIFYFMTFSDSLEYYNELQPAEWWQDTWWPIFTDGCGDLIITDLAKDGSGKVYHLHKDFAQVVLEYSSLGRFFHTIAAAFQQNIFYTRGTGRIEEVPRAFDSLAAQLNPEIAWWNDPEFA